LKPTKYLTISKWAKSMAKLPWRFESDFLQVGTGRQQQTETQWLRERKRENNEKYDIIKKTQLSVSVARTLYRKQKPYAAVYQLCQM
jgi:hypothetical protein